MGCSASKQVANTAEQPQPMKEVKSTEGSKGGIAFEIPADELKVSSNQPTNLAASTSKKSLDKLDEDPEVLKQKLKAKEEQAEKNRQKELEQIQAKSKKREEQTKAAQERKKKIEEEGGPQQGDETAGPAATNDKPGSAKSRASKPGSSSALSGRSSAKKSKK